MVECDGASAEEDKSEGKGGQSQGEFVAVLAHQSVMEVHLGNGDGHVNADGKSSGAGKQADQHEQAAKKFGEGGEICGPAGQSEAGNELNVVVKSSENFLVPVADHDGAQGKTHDQQSQGLQAIKVAQVIASGRTKHRLQQRSN